MQIRLLLVLAVSLSAVGCSSAFAPPPEAMAGHPGSAVANAPGPSSPQSSPGTPTASPPTDGRPPEPPATAPAAAPAGKTAGTVATAAPQGDASGHGKKPRSANWTLCARPVEAGEKRLETARRRLEETSCAATLWLDGLFGDETNVGTARQTWGRVELSGQHSDYDGDKVRLRFSARYDLPNLDKRVNAFLGRDDADDFVQDRSQGFSLRSPFSALETEERWLAGLGYSLPGGKRQSTDFRLGLRVRSSPVIFGQARHRRLLHLDDENAWRLRTTAFWTNREGWGLTNNLDFDHLVSETMLLRWGSRVTWSEETEGLDWSNAWVLYHNLQNQRAIAYETFIRGATDAEVALREFGVRTVYRQSVFYRWLFGELVLGYSWPKEIRGETREGSFAFGIGMELVFGRDHW